ncbi:hypothetical protein ILUMI_27231 [Ignelater luminosus]|uniref:C2H2-type domain-containing protein n=1 Tax=Ignelater luminosus TaxID=2038154 RepID=A0A8K0C6L2_IGNLU|nr:hypothetical protein ILUMI_27231 [Ignelater luminosus]
MEKSLTRRSLFEILYEKKGTGRSSQVAHLIDRLGDLFEVKEDEKIMKYLKEKVRRVCGRIFARYEKSHRSRERTNNVDKHKPGNCYKNPTKGSKQTTGDNCGITENSETDKPHFMPSFKCCSRTFLKRKHLFLHMYCQLLGGDYYHPSFVCSICSSKFQFCSEFTLHSAEHYTLSVSKLKDSKVECNPVYVCNICSINFEFYLELYEHSRNHHNLIFPRYKYCCNRCAQLYDSFEAVKKHHLKCRLKRSPRTIKGFSNLITEFGIYGCSPPDETESKDPFVIVIPCPKTSNVSDDMKKLTCDICYDVVDDFEQLVEHVKFHNRYNKQTKKNQQKQIKCNNKSRNEKKQTVVVVMDNPIRQYVKGIKTKNVLCKNNKVTNLPASNQEFRNSTCDSHDDTKQSNVATSTVIGTNNEDNSVNLKDNEKTESAVSTSETETEEENEEESNVAISPNIENNSVNMKQTSNALSSNQTFMSNFEKFLGQYNKAQRLKPFPKSLRDKDGVKMY